MIIRLFIFSFLAFSAIAQVPQQAVAKDAEELWVFAEGLFERTWYKDAIKEYENFLKSFPKSDKVQSVRWRLFECYSKLNDNASKMAALDAFIQNEKDITQREKARMNKARMLFEMNSHDDALKIYENIDQKVEGGELWESARYEAARIFLKKGKEGEAFLRFRQLASLDYKGNSPIRAYAIFALSTLLSEKNQTEEAIKQYNRLTLVKGTPPEIAENSWYNLGVIYFSAGKYNQAQKSFLEIVNNYPDGAFRESAINQTGRCYIQETKQLEAMEVLKLNDNATGRIALERDYLKAYAHWQLKEYEKAIKLFDVCIKNEIPNYREDATFNKINCLHDMGKNTEVVAEAGTYLKIYKDSPYKADVNYIAGQNAEKLKKYDQAEVFFRQALKSYAGEWNLVDNTYFALADVLLKMEKFEAEAAVWEELAKRERSQFRDTALLKGSEAWLKCKKSDNALKLLNEYLKLFPKGEDVHYVRNRIAEIYIVDSKFKEAAEFLVNLLKTDVKQDHRSALQSVLGRVYYYQKDYEKAIRELESCLASENLSPEIKSDCLVYLGFSRISGGKEQEGVKNLAAAFENRKDFSSLLTHQEENAVALLLEKYNYNKVASAIYTRLLNADERKIKMSGMIGIARLAVQSDKPADGLNHLKQVLELCTEKDLPERVSALSIMGEIYYKTGKDEQALQTFDFALKMKAGDEESICRSLYGMALILKSKKEFDKARRYANQVFILYNDQQYSPRAMFLSLQCSMLTSKKIEAAQTARELKKKFPIHFAKIEVQDYLKEHDINTD